MQTLKISQVSQHGFTELLITYFMIIFAAERKQQTWNAREVDAANSTEQVNVGEQMDVYQSLRTLKEIERTCITLFYMEDVSIDKIAGITGCPVGTVKSHLSRAKDKLAIYLKQNGYDGNR